MVRLNSTGVVDYSTYLGGPGGASATDVAFDQTGDLYVTGFAGYFFPTLASSFAPLAAEGGFVTRLDHLTGQLVYSTYIPGAGGGATLSIRVDGSQNAYIAGSAGSVLPTTPGAFQTDANNGKATAFLLELNPAGTELVFSTLIGGSSADLATGLALTGDLVTIAGITDSYDFPATDHSMPFCNVISIPTEDYTPYSTFVASFDHTGKLLFSSEYSGCDDERVVAITPGPDGLLMAGSYEWLPTSFLLSMDLSTQNPVQIAAIADAASLQIGPYCPLEILSIFGRGLGPRQGASASPSGGYFPTTLAGTKLTFNGQPTTLLYVGDTQINAVVPGEILTGFAEVTVTASAGTSASYRTWIESATPAIFSANETGVGQGAILNQDGTVNSASNPAARGSVVSIFGTGGGATSPLFGDGQVVPAAALLTAAQYMGVVFDNVPATVTYAGTAPFLVNGAMQVNAEVPTDINPGPAVPIVIMLYPFLSQSGITLAVK